MYNVLKKINGPKDLKGLSIDELKELALDVREALFNRLTKKAGHFGSNFGAVELEIAMHYVFDSPKDKFVFDVSHQAYPHKILTGRKEAFTDETKFKTITGYTDPKESEHDMFNIGHTSTAISLASGLAKSRDLKNEKFNVLAVVGDGSLSGGEALEGLNAVGSELKSNFIVVLNDNDQFISESHGALSEHLKELRAAKGDLPNNIFKCLGFEYIYEENGNEIEPLIDLFKKVKDVDHPVVLHIHTIKGYGYDIAIKNKELWHWSEPFNRDTGVAKYPYTDETYFTVLNNYIMDRAKKDEKFLLVNPSYAMCAELTDEQRKILGKKYIDVGIAEEHAVAMSSGAAKNGTNVLLMLDASFVLRALDQIIQDLSLNDNPATLLIHYSSVGCEDKTHLGIFTAPIYANVPNIQVLVPTCKKELIAMLDWSLNQKEHPTMIFVPRGDVSYRDVDTNFTMGKFLVEKKGSEIAIIAVAAMFDRGNELVESIKKEMNIDATLINPRFISGVDKETLDMLKKDHKLVVTLEDNCKNGGFGEKVAEFYGDSNMKVKSFGLEKLFYEIYEQDDVFKEYNLTNEKILEQIKNIYKSI